MNFDINNPPTDEQVKAMTPEQKKELLTCIEKEVSMMVHRILAQNDAMKAQGRSMPTPEEFATAALGLDQWRTQ